MKRIPSAFCVLIILLVDVTYSAGQEIRRYNGKVGQQLVVNQDTPIIDEASRKRVPYRVYLEKMRSNPNKFKLEPIFDKFGVASSFMLRERRNGELAQMVEFDENRMPEIGEKLAPFVMIGLDGETYDSEKLLGKYVLLGFWVRYEKPLYTFASTKVISEFVEENKLRGIDIVSLGTTLDDRATCLRAIPKNNCGFVPVPESYGFNHRYHIGETPYFILLNKNGEVIAMAPHTEFFRIGGISLR